MHVSLRRLGSRRPGRRALSSLLSSIGDFLNPQPQLAVEELLLWKQQATSGGTGGNIIRGWSAATDNDYGGKSLCHVTAAAGGYMRIEGMVSYDKALAESTKVKGGFCAIHGKCEPVVDLRDYEGLRVTLRSPRDQSFTVNLKSTSLFDDDIYQVRCEIKGSSEWRHISMPFERFHLTARGLQRDRHRANDSLRVEALGFLFKEEDAPGDGRVVLEIKEVVAVEKA